MRRKSLEEFFLSRSSDCLAVVLIMAGFEAEVVICAIKLSGGTVIAMPAVIAEGKLFNIGRQISTDLGKGVYTHDVQAIPDKVPEGSPLYQMLIVKQFRQTVTPWNIPDDVDKADIDVLKRYACRFIIHQHYLDCEDRTKILKLYEKYNTIEEAIGETTEEFKKRFDEFIKRYRTGNEACMRLGTVDRICWQQLNIKEDTRRKLHWQGL